MLDEIKVTCVLETVLLGKNRTFATQALEDLYVTVNGWVNGGWLPGRPSSSSSCLGASSRSVPEGQQGRPLTSGTHILEMARWPQITWEMVQPQADWGLTNAKAQAEASDALQEPRFQRQLEPQITIELCHELAT